MANLELNYYVNNGEAEQSGFYRIPKALLTDERYRCLSLSAKFLYALLLDRMSLSAKNGWTDKEGRVYIYFRLDEVMAQIGCGHTKAVKLFAELEQANLIERRKQGMGKPVQIYVKGFALSHQTERSDERDDSPSARKRPSTPARGCPDASKTPDRPVPFPAPEARRDAPVPEPSSMSERLETWENYDFSRQESFPVSNSPSRWSIEIERCRAKIRKNIDYKILRAEYPREILAGCVDLMAEICCSRRNHVRISGNDLPAEAVRKRFLNLNRDHITYVLDCIKGTTTHIRNIRAYLLASLYNAPLTMNAYYAARVQYDLYGQRLSCAS